MPWNVYASDGEPAITPRNFEYPLDDDVSKSRNSSGNAQGRTRSSRPNPRVPVTGEDGASIKSFYETILSDKQIEKRPKLNTNNKGSRRGKSGKTGSADGSTQGDDTRSKQGELTHTLDAGPDTTKPNTRSQRAQLHNNEDTHSIECILCDMVLAKGVSYDTHTRSTVHQLHVRLRDEEAARRDRGGKDTVPAYGIQRSNLGYRLLNRLGWEGGGLGAQEQGRVEPVRAVYKNDREGLTVSKQGTKRTRRVTTQSDIAKALAAETQLRRAQLRQAIDSNPRVLEQRQRRERRRENNWRHYLNN